MFNKLFPDMIFESIYDIDFSVLQEKGIKGLILDIDNTLVSHTEPVPRKETLDLILKLKNMGFLLAIISNGKKQRVDKFTKGFDIPVISGHTKPKKSGYILALNKLGIPAFKCAAIGDQIFTDILGANRMGLLSIFTQPIEKYENSFFYIKRFFENIVLKYEKRKHYEKV